MWFIRDSGGIFCVILTYSFFSGISIVIVKVCLIPLASEEFLNLPAALLTYFLFISLAIISHAKCMLTDPGSVPRLSYPTLPTCEKCSSPKPHRVHHCSTCSACILKMDHHCPWMNNCIGYFNQKHFFLFLVYTEISCLYSISLIILRATYCKGHSDSELCKTPVENNSLDFMMGLASLLVLGLFGLFVAFMICDQVKCISANTTGIEVLKKELIEKRPAAVNFEETFGGKFGVKWFFPVEVSGSVEDYLNKLANIN